MWERRNLLMRGSAAAAPRSGALMLRRAALRRTSAAKRRGAAARRRGGAAKRRRGEGKGACCGYGPLSESSSLVASACWLACMA